MVTNADKARWAREWRRRKRLGLYQPHRGENLRKHGVTKSPEHRSWLSMMARCVWSTPGFKDNHLYKGKGIIVCDRWMDFAAFLEDMGPKPTPQHTLDRIDSDGNYEPANCRWATRKEQARNWKTRNRKYELNGVTHTESEWAELIGITGSTLRERVEKWSVVRALSTPPIRVRERGSRGTFKAALY